MAGMAGLFYHPNGKVNAETQSDALLLYLKGAERAEIDYTFPSLFTFRDGTFYKAQILNIKPGSVLTVTAANSQGEKELFQHTFAAQKVLQMQFVGD